MLSVCFLAFVFSIFILACIGRCSASRVQGSLEAPALHVVGDVHGDENYLVRSLLSTELFVLQDNEIIWRQDLAESDDSKVVVLGDMIDRGSLSKRCLHILKRLDEAEQVGDRFHVLLGNHEDVTLRYQMAIWTRNGLGDAYMKGDWDSDQRELALRAAEGTEDYDMMRWLRTRKVAYLHNDIILTHGGLSEKVVVDLLAKPDMPYTSACGNSNDVLCAQELVNYFNKEAASYYENMHACIARSQPPTFGKFSNVIYNKFTAGYSAEDCVKRVASPAFLLADGYKGILVYRGYSALTEGANTDPSCEAAQRVGHRIGVNTMVVAHTTHAHSMELCSEAIFDAGFPIFVVDTHPHNCGMRDGCNFHPSHGDHGTSIDRTKPNVPQSLRLFEDSESGTTCLSHLVAGGDGSMTTEVDCELTLVMDGEGVPLRNGVRAVR